MYLVRFVIVLCLTGTNEGYKSCLFLLSSHLWLSQIFLQNSWLKKYWYTILSLAVVVIYSYLLNYYWLLRKFWKLVGLIFLHHSFLFWYLLILCVFVFYVKYFLWVERWQNSGSAIHCGPHGQRWQGDLEMLESWKVQLWVKHACMREIKDHIA